MCLSKIIEELIQYFTLTGHKLIQAKIRDQTAPGQHHIQFLDQNANKGQ